MMENKTNVQRANALDGIRVLAILGVIFYHIMPYKVSGGFLGVDLFLILAGYLLTINTKHELTRQKFKFNVYLKKRVSRLYRPMLTLVVIILSFMTIFIPTLLINSRLHVLESLTFTANWMQIVRGESYFDMYLSPNVFNHLWYISLYMQLIIVLPLLILIFERLVKEKKVIAYLLILLSLVSALLMGMLFQVGSDPTRVYYGTDTRSFSFLLGIFLAYVWPYDRLKGNISSQHVRILNSVGLVSLVVVALFMFRLNDKSFWTYRGGIFIFDLFSLLLIATSLQRQTLLNKFLQLRIFRGLSLRSFYYYLWYYPIVTIYEYQYSQIMPNLLWHIITQLVLIILFGEFFYRLFHQKTFNGFFSRHYLRKCWQIIQTWRANQKIETTKLAQIIILSILPLIAGWGLITSPSKPPVQSKELTQQKSEMVENDETNEKEKAGEIVDEDDGTIEDPEPLVKSATNDTNQSVAETKPALPEFPGLSKTERMFARDLNVTFYGDSILLGLEEKLQSVFINSNVNGQVGRQLYQSYSELQQMLQNGQIQDEIVIFLGTNGGFSVQQVESIINLLKDHKIAFVNVNVDRSWEAEVNKVYDEIRLNYPEVQVIDWKDFSNGQSEWFGDDGVHPNELGREKMVQLIVKSLINSQVDNN